MQLVIEKSASRILKTELTPSLLKAASNAAATRSEFPPALGLQDNMQPGLFI